MADSNITKKALASALKELVNKKPISKIRIGEICDLCDMNRKSFYYHFKDKNDLINWIFDTEFVNIVADDCTNIDDIKKGSIDKLINYLYDNKNFYKKVLKEKDQNCLSEHFRELIEPFIRSKMEELLGENALDFYVDFLIDGFISAIEKWITNDDALTGAKFCERMHICERLVAEKKVEQL